MRQPLFVKKPVFEALGCHFVGIRETLTIDKNTLSTATRRRSALHAKFSNSREDTLQELPPEAFKAAVMLRVSRFHSFRTCCKPNKAQQSPTKPNKAQQSPTKPNKAQQSPTKPNKAQQSPTKPVSRFTCPKAWFSRHGFSACSCSFGEKLVEAKFEHR